MSIYLKAHKCKSHQKGIVLYKFQSYFNEKLTYFIDKYLIYKLT